MRNMKWIKTVSEISFELQDNNETILQMSFNYKQKGHPVSCKTNKSNFTIVREGFWKSNILIKENEELIGKTYTEKWFSNHSILEVKGHQVKYKYRNNAMAELVFFVENEDDFLLACGLKTNSNGMADVALSTGQSFDQNPLKYYLLAVCWYIFLPIAQENTVDFLLLIS